MLRSIQFRSLICLRSINSIPFLARATAYIDTQPQGAIESFLQTKEANHLSIRRQIHGNSPLQKYNKKASEAEDSDAEDEVDAEFKDERDSKVVKTKVNSLRADLLLKAGLSIARNKIEAIFYESRVRVNGQKLPKKSVQVQVGDEIDVIRGFSQNNPQHLVIARVVVLSATERDEGLSVALRRYKTLLIENYAGQNAYKSSEAVSH